MDYDELINRLSKLLYDFFVTNNTVVSLQMPDGRYIPQIVNYDFSLFEEMIKTKESLAVYQQKKHSDLVKWICLDFDCTKSGNGNIETLYDKYIKEIRNTIEKNNLNYLLEFSGRRGIHVWIIFDYYIVKEIAYKIEMILLTEIQSEIDMDEDYGVDLFPATMIGKNKYGKAVKLPLSLHKKGGQSYFFETKSELLNKNNFSYERQYEILAKYKKNSVNMVSLFSIDYRKQSYQFIFKKEYVINQSKKLTLQDILDKCKGSKVLNGIFDNVRYSSMTYYDKLVICSTFGHFSDKSIIYDIFQSQENYDEYKTNYYVSKLVKQLYPITMRYLYDQYHEKLEDEIDGNLTVLEYICNHIGIKVSSLPEKELKPYQKIKELSKKELNYLLYNDEVININDYYDLKNITNYECKQIYNRIEKIFKGDFDFKNNDILFNKYERYEEGKKRILISLSPDERLFTTALIFEFAQKLRWRFDSYSYNINFYNFGGVFFPWYDSWKNYQRSVELYLSFDIFKNYGLIKLDIRKFYDNIYFHSIYSEMKDLISKKVINDEINKMYNILTYLTKYNENIMKEINGSIKGVPQGPVYARVLAELFISTIINNFKKVYKEHENYMLFRYVDDIYIVYHDLDGNKLMNDFVYFLSCHGLQINTEKTKKYNSIGEMTDYDKASLFENSKWNYTIQNIRNLELEDVESFDKKMKLFDDYINRNKEWKINDANFILGGYIDDLYEKKYINKYFYDLIKSKKGRGSIFIKLYNIIFHDLDLLKRFFEYEMYTKIPVVSVNFKNFLNMLYFNENTIKKYIDEDKLQDLMLYLNKVTNLDEEDLTTISSLNLIEV